jgi:hypothetical protein
MLLILLLFFSVILVVATMMKLLLFQHVLLWHVMLCSVLSCILAGLTTAVFTLPLQPLSAAALFNRYPSLLTAAATNSAAAAAATAAGPRADTAAVLLLLPLSLLPTHASHPRATCMTCISSAPTRKARLLCLLLSLQLSSAAESFHTTA